MNSYFRLGSAHRGETPFYPYSSSPSMNLTPDSRWSWQPGRWSTLLTGSWSAWVAGTSGTRKSLTPWPGSSTPSSLASSSLSSRASTPGMIRQFVQHQTWKGLIKALPGSLIKHLFIGGCIAQRSILASQPPLGSILGIPKNHSILLRFMDGAG